VKPISLNRRLDALEGKDSDGQPVGELWLPPNGRDLLPRRRSPRAIGTVKLFNPERRAVLEAQGIEHYEALRRSELTDDEVAAYVAAAKAAAEADDDVGDAPPGTDRVTAPGDTQ